MSHDDSDLRALLHETAEGITPRGDFDEIRGRIMSTPTQTRRWVLPAAVAAAVIGLAVGGTTWMLRDDNGTTTTPPPATQSPDPTPNPTDDATAKPDVHTAVPVYFVGDVARGGPKLYREFQKLFVCQAVECKVTASASTAVAGEPNDPDYRNPWPAGSGVAKAEYDGDVLTIDLTGDVHDRPASMNTATAQLAIEQLIYSAQAGLGEGRVPVQLTLNGGRTDMVLGVPTSEPLSAGEELDVLAPVQITSPSNGDTLPAGVIKVRGVAATFEANVLYEVLGSDGAVVDQGFTTARECCKLAEYVFNLDLEAGTYTIRVHDSDESGGEGNGGVPVENEDTKEIVVE